MAAYTLLLLVIALSATAAYALQCYTCDTQLSNANCLTATTCASNATSCETDLISVKGGSVTVTSITKTCVASCSASSTTFGPSTFTTTCCSTDLCNTSGGANVKSSCAAIILALGSLVTILKSSVL